MTRPPVLLPLQPRRHGGPHPAGPDTEQLVADSLLTILVAATLDEMQCCPWRMVDISSDVVGTPVRLGDVRHPGVIGAVDTQQLNVGWDLLHWDEGEEMDHPAVRNASIESVSCRSRGSQLDFSTWLCALRHGTATNAAFSTLSSTQSIRATTVLIAPSPIRPTRIVESSRARNSACKSRSDIIINVMSLTAPHVWARTDPEPGHKIMHLECARHVAVLSSNNKMLSNTRCYRTTRCKQMTQVATTTEPIEAASDREQLLAKIAELEAQVQKQKEEVADSGPSIDLERILDQALARQVAEMG